VSKTSESRPQKWLRRELPALVAAGVITSEVAAAIERHYAAVASSRKGFGFIILAAIGSALIGAGIILLVAHNWDDLSRPLRCAIAFFPLVASICLGLFVLLRRLESAAWREGVSLFNIAAFAASLSLVSQTYQIQGSFAGFIGVCLLVALPVVYLFGAHLTALIYIIGCGLWVVTKADWSFDRPGQTFFWLFIAAIIPFYLGVYRKGRRGWTFGALSVALVASGMAGLVVTETFSHLQIWPVVFGGFFALVYLCGICRTNESINTLTVLGALGIVATALVLTFADPWRLRDVAPWASLGTEQHIAGLVCILFPAAALGLAVWAICTGQIEYSIAAACLPAVAFVGHAFGGYSHATVMASVLFNIYALVLGAELLIRGIRADSVTRANFGLLVIALLACCRFFDSDMSFVSRGVGFIAVGAAFLVANILFFKNRASA
jgi:uncharacterized membrane protein